MVGESRWKMIEQLDEELLKGSVIVSEWCAFIVREADIAFVGEAHLATIVTATAGIETYLRSEYEFNSRETLFAMIEQASIEEGLRSDIHALRKFRNRWVHVADPGDNAGLLDDPVTYEQELEDMAWLAVRTLRRVIYQNQWV